MRDAAGLQHNSSSVDAREKPLQSVQGADIGPLVSLKVMVYRLYEKIKETRPTELKAAFLLQSCL